MDGMICTVCEKQKHELKRKNSKCLPGVVMFLCSECLKAGREPRGYIILAGIQGVDISQWIKPKRYLGEEITVRELT